MDGVAVNLPRSTLLRQRGQHDGGKVSMVELFFDLVFVFAITQLSHGLLAHLSPQGVLHTLMLFMAVWWLWIFTSWVTNWLDPEKIPVRIMLFALMLAGLLLSSSIPEAFADKGLVFGCVFAAMQVGRTAFMLWALRDASPALLRNFIRIFTWLAVSGVFWIGGGLQHDEMRVALWMVAIVVEYLSPVSGFWVPGLGRSSTTDWDVDGSHMAERCALFVIIALGESILVTGATFSGLRWDQATTTAFFVAFLGSVAMWWVYFDTAAERATHRIVHSDDPGRIARIAYTYLHLLIVGGIILCAVADELILVHPGHADTLGIAVILGGPALYLLGNALFKWVSNDRPLPPFSHLAGLAVLAGVAPFAFGHAFSALGLGMVTTSVLVLVAGWESLALRRSRADG
jgi:low temperature requirement protein LtrA